eukprot:CAMPEP_0183586086 /NCGR_PEP_ID=MMETSP0371-20130417/156530_1 /TAXON_ID=268820 /ORGANISM="Peridinium aciculiferum, Strain PAER-2" /LENGTH=127 /DNA_ID=CAMNT_0025797129 /DNA_START=143 /DNA_END=524 /DNA_ORIENTATION=-
MKAASGHDLAEMIRNVLGRWHKAREQGRGRGHEPEAGAGLEEEVEGWARAGSKSNFPSRTACSRRSPIHWPSSVALAQQPKVPGQGVSGVEALGHTLATKIQCPRRGLLEPGAHRQVSPISKMCCRS